MFRTTVNIVESKVRGDNILSIIKQCFNDVPTNVTAGSSDENSFCHTYRVYQQSI
ncbi:hypothetical protein MCC01953_19760 [Bifidobacteriaceae bacterium MCC01953]|nr:hypothetical protein MCC01953_19760 [Bifidobacteriaceae bacterium MCC01953]